MIGNDRSTIEMEKRYRKKVGRMLLVGVGKRKEEACFWSGSRMGCRRSSFKEPLTGMWTVGFVFVLQIMVFLSKKGIGIGEWILDEE